MVEAITLVYGVAAGAINAGLGYMRNRRKKEKFDKVKLIRTSILGAILALGIGYGIPADNMNLLLETSGATYMLDKVLKLIGLYE